MILVQILLNASRNGFQRKTFDLWKNGAIKYITHLDKFSYFNKNKSFIADNCPYTYIKKFKNTSTKIQHRKLKLMKWY